MTKRVVLLILILVSIALAAFLIGQAFLGFHHVVTLRPAPDLTDIVSQDSITTSQTTPPLIGGKDFSLQEVTYFENREWVVAKTVHTQQDNDATVVLHKINGTYQTVLGPGTSFPGGYIQSLPKSVVSYLITKGMFDES